jgi:demethylmenaquinone methyltransferase/2-methoxy-6-polyprenyl-1,4-benzoquinol methylase
VKVYYDRRAPEYDDWYLGIGRFADRERPGWNEELDQLTRALEALPPASTLDVACGTGFLTRHLPGEVTCLDQSARMLRIALERVPRATGVEAEAIPLPFPDDSFDRVFTAHFYGHLEEPEREAFLAEARRVAQELVVVDASIAQGAVPEDWQTRILNDGSEWQVYKRYFSPDGLSAELEGGAVFHAGRWFLGIRSPRPDT